MVLLLFVLLQIGDAATTLLFLTRGVLEGNPLVSAALSASEHPAVVLAAIKVAACGLAWIAWKSGRRRLLSRANWFFAACVVWNLVATL